MSDKTILYNGKPLSKEQVTEHCLMEHEGKYISASDFTEWIERRVDDGSLRFLYSYDTWLNDMLPSIQRDAKGIAQEELLELLPGAENRSMRREFRKTKTYTDICLSIQEKLISTYGLDYWEEHEEQLRLLALFEYLDARQPFILRKIQDHNMVVAKRFLDSIDNMQELLEQEEERITQEIQQKFDDWLQGSEIRFNIDDDDELELLSEGNLETFLSIIETPLWNVGLCSEILGDQYLLQEDFVSEYMLEYLNASKLMSDANFFRTFFSTFMDELIDARLDIWDGMDNSRRHVLACLASNPRYRRMIRSVMDVQ